MKANKSVVHQQAASLVQVIAGGQFAPNGNVTSVTDWALGTSFKVQPGSPEAKEIAKTLKEARKRLQQAEAFLADKYVK